MVHLGQKTVAAQPVRPAISVAIANVALNNRFPMPWPCDDLATANRASLNAGRGYFGSRFLANFGKSAIVIEVAETVTNPRIVSSRTAT
jgi:hypothetical protein